MNINEAILELMKSKDLSKDQISSVIRQILTGECADSQISAFLVSLSIKGETVDEVIGAAEVMRELSEKVIVNIENLVDTCGTGGDGSGLFNVSTSAAILAAAAGAKVAKHGNRSASSTSGSADLLEQAGVNLALSPDQVRNCIEEVGVGFMFAPAHHSAMKHVMGPRKELGIRTIFNLLGPLTNPAGAKNQVLGVFDKSWVRPIAEVLRGLGSDRVMVIHSEDGLDEFSVEAATLVAELREGEIREYTVTPEDLGVNRSSISLLKVASPQESLVIAKDSLSGENTVGSEMISMASGAALYVSGLVSSLKDGFKESQLIIEEEKAIKKLDELISFTNR